jgi:CPL (NUC119) domain.
MFNLIFPLSFRFSKKDRDIRNKEILEAVSEPLLSSIAKDADFWLSTGSVAMVTAVILKNALGKSSFFFL